MNKGKQISNKRKYITSYILFLMWILLVLCFPYKRLPREEFVKNAIVRFFLISPILLFMMIKFASKTKEMFKTVAVPIFLIYQLIFIYFSVFAGLYLKNDLRFFFGGLGYNVIWIIGMGIKYYRKFRKEITPVEKQQL